MNMEWEQNRLQNERTNKTAHSSRVADVPQHRPCAARLRNFGHSGGSSPAGCSAEAHGSCSLRLMLRFGRAAGWAAAAGLAAALAAAEGWAAAAAGLTAALAAAAGWAAAAGLAAALAAPAAFAAACRPGCRAGCCRWQRCLHLHCVGRLR